MGSTARTDEWFRLAELEPGVYVIEEPWHDEQVKSYLILGRDRAVLLDTGMGVGDLRRVVRDITALPITVVHSHDHWDHIGGTHQLAGEAEILIHPDAAHGLRSGVPSQRMRQRLAPEHLSGPFAEVDLAEAAFIPGIEPSGLLRHGQILDLGDRRLEVLEVPGHCEGLIALWDAGNAALFSTDAVYAGPLYAQMADSDLAAYLRTLTALSELRSAPRAIYPAHGPTPIAPELLPAMRDAMAQVLDGRVPDTVAAGVATFEFPGFAILTSWPLDAGTTP